MTDKLKKKISQLPDSPGVYLMKDSAGKIIYVGKAKSLKKRVQSYFTRPLDTKTQALVAQIALLDWQLCLSESLALLLEAALISKYKPKYNVSLRDDKSFPFVKISNEEFPAIYITRKKIQDGSSYIGPYTSAKLLAHALKVIRRKFPYRSCRALPKKSCIYYRLGLSPAPCIGKINPAQYRHIIKNITLILEGKTQDLIKRLAQEMESKSKEQKFEEAAKLRDRINALTAIGESKVGRSREDELRDLQRLLHLKKLPLRIEAFDISNIFGKEATGSMVSFHKGLPDKDNYRRFRIKTVQVIDDYRMLREVISRRYSRLLEEKLAPPDLILIDGGKAHLLTGERMLQGLKVKIPLVSIAKEEEHIYTLGSPQPLKLSQDTPALNLIRRVRDEAHRFAVSYHHILRRKKIIGK